MHNFLRSIESVLCGAQRGTLLWTEILADPAVDVLQLLLAQHRGVAQQVRELRVDGAHARDLQERAAEVGPRGALAAPVVAAQALGRERLRAASIPADKAGDTTVEETQLGRQTGSDTVIALI